MKLKVMFIAAAFYGVLIGLLNLIVPGFGSAEAYMNPSPYLLLVVRFFGLANLFLGLIAWLVRNADPSEALDGVILGLTGFFGGHALLSLYGHFTDTTNSYHWVFAIVQGLLAAGFLAASRRGKAGRAS